MADGHPPRNFYSVDTQNFKALCDVGATPLILPQEPGEIGAYLGIVDGLLVTGGGYQFNDKKLFRNDGSEPAEKEARSRFEIELIRSAMTRNIPILAVCGGFQTLNCVTGGDLVISLKDSDSRWVRHRGSSFTELAHLVRVSSESQLSRILGVGEFQVNTRHRQGVVTVGTQAVASGVSDDGLVESIEVPSQQFCIGVQWHPEFFLTDADRRLFTAFVEASCK